MAFAVLAADALSVEPVGRRFFREFRATLDRVAAGLPGPMRADDRHGLALLQLTRVLFLYFIQTKGWLGSRERFLAEEVDRCLARRRQIHRDLLRPLFFGTLNQPAELRSRTVRAFGDIPFLNGGLFEPHRLERKYYADIPNGIWRDAFDRLFERFHFTVCERDRSGGIAPDMLGRVFEGAMAPEARRASGTFYTPVSLVEELLDAALIALIGERTGCGDRDAQERIQNRDPEAVNALRTLTLLDPAVGSGAFLLGALERLASIERDERQRSVRKRYVLRHNLFGVDRSAAAVRLTELRLWLAVIADDPAERSDAVSPLPNLDCLIRQGDSLFDPLGWTGGVWIQEAELSRELASLRQQAVTAAGPTKRWLMRRLRAIEGRALDHSLAMAEEKHRSEIANCLRHARANDLFGQRRGLEQASRAAVLGLRTGLRQVRQARRKLARDGEVPWFHYPSHFADVFAAGGFDIVIGNPPWLRSELLDREFRSRLSGRYRWWRSSSRCYGNGPDLAVAFLERGLELTASAGVVAMLVPAKVTSAAYGAAARHALASTTRLHAVADLTGSPQGFEATVYPLAIVAAKKAPLDEQLVRTTLSLDEQKPVVQAKLRGGGPWILVGDRVRDAVTELEQNQPQLGQNAICHLGLKTGANRVFLNPPDELEAEVVRWAIRGRDLKAFRWHSRTRLLWTHDNRGNPRRELPPKAAAYLEGHQAELRARKDFKGGPPWALFRTQPAVAPYRVVWADLARRLAAVSLSKPRDREYIPLNSCYVAPMRTAAGAERLAAWLNSTWLRAVARIGAVPAASGFARFNAQVVARLPLPAKALADVRLSRITREGRAGRAVQEELDDIVALQLELSASAKTALRSVVDSAAQHRR